MHGGWLVRKRQMFENAKETNGICILSRLSQPDCPRNDHETFLGIKPVLMDTEVINLWNDSVPTTGAVQFVDCDWDTKNVLTGSADDWDCKTSGSKENACDRSLTRGFDFSGHIITFSTDKQMSCRGFMNFFDLRDPQIVL